ncbi:MAG: methionine--tRNA ligase [Deltaproteobacteria bacterium]|nr:methionine--tRNA ligase [Deltaproteobacteria bacterium]
MNRYYLTTPIYYVNDVPHLGTAYTTIVADAISRYHRLRGHDTRFLTGTDEHGEKIERSAKEKGIDVRKFVDDASARFRDAWPPLGVEFDDFIRTTDKRHVEVVQDLWERCRKNGHIYEGTYEGLYCVGCEGYYTEKELTPTPEGLLCPMGTHKPAEKVKEPTFFFRLSAFEQRLLDFYEKNPGFVSPESRRNEVMSFVKGGLQDLSISRTSFSWGIPVPGDTRHVMYVWFDALTNYLSALGPEGTSLRSRFWPPDLHLVGKDILRFHAVYWPAFLFAAGFDEAHLPRKVFAHGWLTINGQKMSKSLRNVVEPLKLAEVFGTDVVRYYLLREINFGQDGDFSHAQLVARYNAELADSLGNLLNRTLGLCAKLRGGGVAIDPTSARGELEARLEEQAATAVLGSMAAWDEVAPHRAIESTWTLIRAANKYVDEAAPWAEAKKGDAGKARVDVILATALETLRWISALIWPVMPEVSAKIRAQLGVLPLAPKQGEDLLRLHWEPRSDTSGLSLGTPVFPKIDADRQAAIFAELGVVAAAPEPSSEKAEKADKKGDKKPKAPLEPAAEITYEEFARLDLRIGKVVSCERVPKSDKLLKCQVDVGEPAPRQVVAGIGKTFAPEDLVGKQVVVVANLKPAKLMGLESRGMILAASGEGEGDLALLAPGKERAAGVRVK